jgi:hypothetical protein
MTGDRVATLIVRSGPLAGLRVEVAGPGEETVIGRGDVDLPLDDPDVSRRHASVRVAGGRLEVTDLASLNGTLVNGVRVYGTTPLENGDTIQIGDDAIQVEIAAVSGGASTPPLEKAWFLPVVAVFVGLMIGFLATPSRSASVRDSFRRVPSAPPACLLSLQRQATIIGVETDLKTLLDTANHTRDATKALSLLEVQGTALRNDLADQLQRILKLIGSCQKRAGVAD